MISYQYLLLLSNNELEENMVVLPVLKIHIFFEALPFNYSLTKIEHLIWKIEQSKDFSNIQHPTSIESKNART